MDISIKAQVVVDGISAAVPAIDEMDSAEVQDIVTVMIMAGNNSIHVSHFTELGKEAAVEP